jgi:hypothetical protein
MLAGLIRGHVFDDPVFHQLRDDVVPFCIGIIISGVGNLERQFSQGDTGISCARANPENTCILRRPHRELCLRRRLPRKRKFNVTINEQPGSKLKVPDLALRLKSAASWAERTDYSVLLGFIENLRTQR